MRGLLGMNIKEVRLMRDTFNIILLFLAIIYTLLLSVFGGDVVNYLQNIVMYLIPIANTVVFNNTKRR